MSASDEASPLPPVARAAEASSEETAAALDRAAEKNEDPEVAEVLDEAAIAAEQTVGRVGWLRSVLNRLFSRPT
jgi:hypothetical protein